MAVYVGVSDERLDKKQKEKRKKKNINNKVNKK